MNSVVRAAMIIKLYLLILLLTSFGLGCTAFSYGASHDWGGIIEILASWTVVGTACWCIYLWLHILTTEQSR